MTHSTKIKVNMTLPTEGTPLDLILVQKQMNMLKTGMAQVIDGKHISIATPPGNIDTTINDLTKSIAVERTLSRQRGLKKNLQQPVNRQIQTTVTFVSDEALAKQQAKALNAIQPLTNKILGTSKIVQENNNVSLTMGTPRDPVHIVMLLDNLIGTPEQCVSTIEHMNKKPDSITKLYKAMKKIMKPALCSLNANKNSLHIS